MRFLNPLGFLGLLSLPVIVGLHLHLERNRREIVSSIFLWQFLDAKFQGEKPKFIKISWLLILDLAIAFIFSTALAEPQLVLPALGKAAVQRVILLDDSVSMLASDDGLDRFSQAKDLVVNLIEESQRRDNLVVLTFGGKAVRVGTTSEQSKRELVGKVMDLAPKGYGVDLRGGLAMAQAQAAADLPLEVYVVTDAAYEFIDVSDFPIQIKWVFIGSEVNNQAVLSLMLEDLETGVGVLFTRIANFSPQSAERDIEVRIDGESVHQETLKLSARSLLSFEYPLPEKLTVIEIRLLGEDIYMLDDQGVISAPIESVVQVALVADEIEPIARAVSAVPNTRLTLYSPGDEVPELLYDLIIYRGYNPEPLPPGSVVLFDPEKDSKYLPLGSDELIHNIPTADAHPVLSGLDLAGVRWETAPSLKPLSENEQTKLQSLVPLIQAGDQPLLLEMTNPNGKVLFLLPGLSDGNFTKSPAFPIFIKNLIEYARNDQLKSHYRYGEVLKLAEQYTSEETALEMPTGEIRPIEKEGQVLLNELGGYSLNWLDEYGDQKARIFGVNGGDKEESNILPREWRFEFLTSEDEIEGEIQPIEVNLAPWLLLVGAILLGLEAWRAWR